MARGRMINQTIDYDPEFNALSIEAQLMYMRALAFLDRDGLIIGHPRGLLSKVAPLMEQMQPLMTDIINEWVTQGLVIRYATKIGDILFFKGFGKNQSGMHYDRESPSRFEPPPGWTHGPKGLVPLESESTPTPPDDSTQTDSGTTPAEVAQESGDSPAQIEVEVKDQDQGQELAEEDDAREPDPIEAAWLETYQAAMPPKIAEKIPKLLADCGEAAVIHSIRASINSESRSFKYIAQCARNYIPPPATNGNGAYHVDLGPPPIPVVIPVSAIGEPQPPPMAGDPWAEVVGDLCRTQPADWPARDWLTGSRLQPAGDVDGVALYRVVVGPHAAAGVGWLTTQAGFAIRRRLTSILGHPVLIEIVAAQPEPQPESEPTP